MNPNNASRRSVAIYIHRGAIDQVRNWLQSRLVGLHRVEAVEVNDEIYHGTYQGVPVAVVLGQRLDEADHSNWLEVDVNSEKDLPWTSDVMFAREAVGIFKLEVRCDPGELRKSSPFDPYEWWAITEHSEGLVTWGLGKA